MLPLNTTQIPTMFNRALGLARSGNSSAALDVFKQLLKLAPNRAEIPFHMGQIYLKAGRTHDAVEFLSNAAALAPQTLQVWQAYAQAISTLADEAARTKAKKALKASNLGQRDRKLIAKAMDKVQTSSKRMSKNATPQEINALVDLVNKAQLEEAQSTAANMIATRGPNEILFTIHGAALAGLGRNEESETAFKQALKIAPDYGEAAAQLGALLTNQGRYIEALKYLQHARSIIPHNPIVLGNFGKALKECGRLRDALEYLDLLLEQDPKNQQGLLTRAQVHLSLENGALAHDDLDQYENLSGKSADIFALKAAASKTQGNIKTAREYIEKALEIDPQSLRVVTIAANILQQEGAMDQADALLRAAVDRDVRSGAVYRMIAQGKKMTLDDPITQEMLTQWDRENLPEEGRADLGFGLSKVMEDIQDYEKSWSFLSVANEIIARRTPHDKNRQQADFDRLGAFLKQFDPDRISKVGQKDNQTIFITGLPRSGTTLVEQILASHSTVTGGDELGILHPLAYQAVAKVDMTGGTIADMSDEDITQLGQDYQDACQRRLPGAKRITDKTISTYQIAPLAWLALPNAKIVALKRDPRDNLWSMFKNRFLSGLHLYTYTQADLVDSYRLYRDYLEQWRSIAPERIYEIEYEKLVSNPEEEVRKLLDFCGLNWEDACLDFHKTNRDVKTLSLAQVRQPLYNSSIGKWRRYESHLGEMLEKLDELDHKN